MRWGRKLAVAGWTYQVGNEVFVFIRLCWQGGSAHWFIIWHPYYYSQCFVIPLQTWLEFVGSQSGQCLWVGGPLVLFKLSSALASPHDLKSTDCGHVNLRTVSFRSESGFGFCKQYVSCSAKSQAPLSQNTCRIATPVLHACLSQKLVHRLQL
jgi:hypothetical protein